MNFDIKDIIQIFSDSNLTKLKLEEDSFKLELVKEENHNTLITETKASHKKEAFPVIEKEVIRLLKKENKVEMENMLTNDTLFVGESNKRNRLRKIVYTGSMSI